MERGAMKPIYILCGYVIALMGSAHATRIVIDNQTDDQLTMSFLDSISHTHQTQLVPMALSEYNTNAEKFCLYNSSGHGAPLILHESNDPQGAQALRIANRTKYTITKKCAGIDCVYFVSSEQLPKSPSEPMLVSMDEWLGQE